MNSESTQGYQDSDVSPLKVGSRRKRKLSLTVLHKAKQQFKRGIRRKSHPYMSDNSSESSNSSSFIIKRNRDNSTLSSEVYRTDSYQFLLPKVNSFNILQKIDEASPVQELRDITGTQYLNISSLYLNNNNGTNVKDEKSSNSAMDIGNSSNVSLLSPELSIVEKLSISKDVLSNIFSEHPTINETQANDTVDIEKLFDDKYVMTEIDVSMPLMQQRCEIECSMPKKPSVSDSLLNKMFSVNIEEIPSLTETLDHKLRDLVLESAKKITKEINNLEKNNSDVKIQNVEKKPKPRKRSSTPRKKKDHAKSKNLNIEPVIEEEKMEMCRSGRKSCPPSIQTFTGLDVVNITEKIQEKTKGEDVKTDLDDKPKGRKKKDVIKVKILRPKHKSLNRNKKSESSTKDTSRLSVNDSGINDSESGVFLQEYNDSVDLIHNHSETCLQANECIGSSVEYVESKTKSIISLDTNSHLYHNGFIEQFPFKDAESMLPEHFCSNAQDTSNFAAIKPQELANGGNTVYHTPVSSETSINSLITEDLSDDVEPNPIQPKKPTKWYLLSEDEFSNTAFEPPHTSIGPGIGANLKQLFPIMCAVPDLSTITEMSKENDDNSRKPTLDLDGDTRFDFDSQSLFD